MNIYQLEVRAVCPHDKNLTDVYEVTLRSSELVKAETIVEWFNQYREKQVYQEDMAHQTSVGLGVHVEIVGVHGPVKITSTYP